IEDIEFRSVTLTAIKGDQGPCLDYGHSVIYKGPYSEVRDDDGHVYYRGERMAVCERTFKMIIEGPYKEDFIGVTPHTLATPKTWCAPAGTVRSASESKGGSYAVSCDTEGCC
ncbi:MAG: methyltransferase, partial [Gammaproteobacteria bacterium]|nr:methyltransferase [Gammaproteobacteria bacterium]